MRRSLATAVASAALAVVCAPAAAAASPVQTQTATPTGKLLGEASKTAVETATPELPTDGLVASNLPVLT